MPESLPASSPLRMLTAMTLPFLAAALTAQLAVEVPSQLMLDPPSVVEVAGGTAVPWEGHGLLPLRPVVRRVTGAYRVITPPGVRGEALQVEVRVQGLSPKGGQGRRDKLPVHVTALPLRLVRESPEASVWEGDLLLVLDPSEAEAGEFQGQLTISVSAR